MKQISIEEEDAKFLIAVLNLYKDIRTSTEENLLGARMKEEELQQWNRTFRAVSSVIHYKRKTGTNVEMGHTVAGT